MVQRIQILAFEIDDQIYGINILSLDEVIPMLEVKAIPGGPEFLEGVFNLRGEIIPVVDIKKQFGRDRKFYSLETRIVIASFRSRRVGFIIDGIQDIKELAEETVQSSVIAPAYARFINSTAKLETGSIVQIIAIDKFLSAEALKQLSEVVARDS